MDSRLGDLARLVEGARKQGARGTELLFETSLGVRLQVQRGKVVDERQLEDESLTVRCWLEGGREAEVRGKLAEGHVLVGRALELAAAAPEDALGGPSTRLQAVLGGLGIFDRRYETIEREDRVDVLIGAERSVRQIDRRLTAEHFIYEDRQRQRTFVNSKNVALEELDTTYEARGAVTGSYDGDPICLEGSTESRTFASIASLPYATTLARRAAGLMQKGDRLDGEVLVMMPPVAVARLFARLATGFTYESFTKGDFFLSPRKDAVLDNRVHLVDDGTIAGGFRTRSFDDRGIAPIPLTLLREGRPDGRFVDTRTARALEVRPSGHLVGDELLPSNLMLRTGTRSMNAIFTERDTWIFLLDDLPDLSGLDLTTGELDAVVSGQVMKSNVAKGAMRNVRLRGNLVEVFNRLEDLASDTDRHGHVDAPGMLVGGFSLGSR